MPTYIVWDPTKGPPRPGSTIKARDPRAAMITADPLFESKDSTQRVFWANSDYAIRRVNQIPITPALSKYGHTAYKATLDGLVTAYLVVTKC
jgi:hypothetical protein